MKIIWFKGDLGNQVFSCALYYYLRKKYPHEKIYGCMKAGPSVVVDKYFDLELPKFNKYMDYLLWVLFKFLEVFHINLLRSTDADFKENVIFYDGYWQNNKFYDRDNKWLKMKLPQDIGQRNWKILKEMKSTNSVSIHVRRGDLKEEVSSYGAPASFDYFINATAFFKKKLYRPYFYFFSDEPEWVKMDLLPRLSVKDCAEVVDINGSDKGYMDLYLLAHCKHHITTKGTLGKFGALLADNPDKYVVLYNDETQQYWKMLLQNPVFI